MEDPAGDKEPPGARNGPPDPARGTRAAREEPAHPGASLSPPGTVPESDVRTHSPAAATPPRERLAFEEDLGELPWGYGDGRLICLVRDPSTLYVYWDLSQEQIKQAFGGLGSAQAILKLCTLRGELVRQVEVHLGGRCWYVSGLPPGAELRAELWAAGEKGARLLRSGRPVRLPAAGPLNVLGEFYAVLPVGVPLPRDGQLSGGRPLDWKAGAEPPDWDRRVGARLGASGYGTPGLPWSGTSPGQPADAAKVEEGGSGRPPGRGGA
ncbi:MAG: hypothetical protein NVS2B9_05020 [Myxococcales bacterium]